MADRQEMATKAKYGISIIRPEPRGDNVKLLEYGSRPSIFRIAY